VTPASGRAEVVEVPDDCDEFNEFAMLARWGDGLPLVPPTPERVERMVAVDGRAPDTSIARIPPLWGDAAVETIAVNAVMAGCKPEYFPFVVTAIAAAAKPEVNLLAAQATTHPCTIMVMLNGPLAQQVGANCGAGAFGSGNRPNATIGRAVRLALQNIGAAYAGDADRSTLGSPAKYSFCFAENEVESPWPPFHVDRGFAPEDSTVTVCAAEPPHNIEDHISIEPEALVGTLAYSIANIGSNNAYFANADLFVGVCPEHARVLDRSGWSKQDLQRQLFATARIPYSRLRDRGSFGIAPSARFAEASNDELDVPMTDTPEDFNIFCIGGPGLHSCWIPTLAAGNSRSATVLVTTANGEPARDLRDFAP
jgi:hypothetical protein